MTAPVHPRHPILSHPVAEALTDLAERLYERTGRHYITRLSVTPDAGLNMGIVPGTSVDVQTTWGPVEVYAERSPRAAGTFEVTMQRELTGALDAARREDDIMAAAAVGAPFWGAGKAGTRQAVMLGLDSFIPVFTDPTLPPDTIEVRIGEQRVRATVVEAAAPWTDIPAPVLDVIDRACRIVHALGYTRAAETRITHHIGGRTTLDVRGAPVLEVVERIEQDENAARVVHTVRVLGWPAPNWKGIAP